MQMDKIKAIEMQMEKSANFRNFGGNGYSNFDASQYQYRYADSNVQQQQVSKLNRNSNIVTLVLTNTEEETQTVTILNPGSGSTPDSTSIPAGCTVSMKQGGRSGIQNYINLMNRISQKPFLIWGLKMKVKDVSQFDNPIVCGYNSGMGSFGGDTLTLEAYGSMYQNESLKLDIKSFMFTVDSDSYLEVPVNGSLDGPDGGERVTLNFFLTAQLQPGRMFNGMDAYAVAPDPYISGLPEVEQTINFQPVGGGSDLYQGRMPGTAQTKPTTEHRMI